MVKKWNQKNMKKCDERKSHVICSFFGNSSTSENSDDGELHKKEQITFRTWRKLKNKNEKAIQAANFI